MTKEALSKQESRASPLLGKAFPQNSDQGLVGLKDKERLTALLGIQQIMGIFAKRIGAVAVAATVSKLLFSGFIALPIHQNAIGFQQNKARAEFLFPLAAKKGQSSPLVHVAVFREQKFYQNLNEQKQQDHRDQLQKRADEQNPMGEQKHQKCRDHQNKAQPQRLLLVPAGNAFVMRRYHKSISNKFTISRKALEESSAGKRFSERKAFLFWAEESFPKYPRRYRSVLV